MIQTDSQLAELLPKLEPFDRVAVDTEADSLHCYYEKLCLVQLSFGGNDYLIDPLSPFLELSPLAAWELYGNEVPCAGVVTGIGMGPPLSAACVAGV